MPSFVSSRTVRPSATVSAGWAVLRGLSAVIGRSLFPFVALILILGTAFWGPWITLALALLWWKVVTRIG